MFSEYNRQMLFPGRRSFRWILLFSITVPNVSGIAQTSAKPSSAADASKGVSLAESGQCSQALPFLKRAVRNTTERELQKRISLDGLRCAMTHNAPYESLVFLEVLSRNFANDPEALYAATHAYSDLSLLTSQTLAREAPFSYQVHLLNAEALELQSKWDEAAAEYHKIIELNPMQPGMHARLGRALLAKPQPTAEAVTQAKKAFEQELEIDPRNASAEYVLGELAKNDGDSSAAIVHYTRATHLDTGFAEAYLGLGTSLVAAKRFSEAIEPLQAYEKFAPDSPTGHYQLALAYSGAGKKDDANREAALQRETAASLEKVKRRVAEGLEQSQSGSRTTTNPDAPK
jgi:tetratricopeptide (TPR) repeat protein